jgi:hypothetical protein
VQIHAPFLFSGIKKTGRLQRPVLSATQVILMFVYTPFVFYMRSTGITVVCYDHY